MNQASERLKANAERILTLWETRANNEVRPAEALTSSILRDALLQVILELAAAIDIRNTQTAKGAAQEFTRLETAQEHAIQRSKTMAYNLNEVILEFHILRQVIFEVLEEETPLSKPDRDFIINSFERTVNNSATVFADIQLKNHERFTLTLVHDLRNPLSVIKLGTHVIRIHAVNAPVLQRALDKIDSNVLKLNGMIAELLDVSRLKAGKSFVVNAKEMRLDELVKQTVLNLIEIYGDRFQARATEEITGSWDGDGLRRILENLAVNALKYGDSTSPIVIQALQNGDQVSLIVHNDGNPIPPGHLVRIFDTFDRTASAPGVMGWGLGLTLVSGMAKAHNGTVWVESSPEKGTDFIVELPRVYTDSTLAKGK